MCMCNVSFCLSLPVLPTLSLLVDVQFVPEVTDVVSGAVLGMGRDSEVHDWPAIVKGVFGPNRKSLVSAE